MNFFSVVMAGQYFFFQIFLWGARYNIRLLSTWHMEFLFLYNSAAVVAAPFKILLAKQHRRFLFTCKYKRRNSANGSLGM
ncbi:MAG TPA: hypothetical protein [Caudoviricetes sp.]|nr:MAG TPA: hypothetical protein [Caudoviricetes sp.]